MKGDPNIATCDVASSGRYVDLGSQNDKEQRSVVSVGSGVRDSAESCIRKAVSERGLNSSSFGLADAKAEDEAASRWADCAVAYGV
jgi:hypothetical protein